MFWNENGKIETLEDVRRNRELFENIRVFAESTPYSPSSRSKYAEICLTFVGFKDYRSYVVKTCKRADLPKVLVNLCNRTFTWLDDVESKINSEIDAKTKREEDRLKMMERDHLVERLWSSLKELDSEERETMLDLIRSGYITETNFSEYGLYAAF